MLIDTIILLLLQENGLLPEKETVLRLATLCVSESVVSCI